jgi:predicted MFS family arabinose efflux permease
MPLAMGALALALAGFGASPLAATIMIALWGLAFGAVPVAWSTWTTRAVPDEAESAGGLLVAAFQVGIAIGAATGGLVFDVSGARGVFTAAGVVLLAAALVVLASVRPQPAPTAT